MKKFVVGIDIGGRSMKFGLFTTEGELINKSNIPTNPENNGKEILPDLVEHLEKIIEKYELNKDNLQGIGIGIPGPILNKKVVKTAVNLGWENNTNVADYIEEKLGYKVLVENDANVAALGELWKGSAEGYKNVVMVTLGTGVGGGIVVDGNIISGRTGSGGEIGHMPFLEQPLSRTCGCGGNECLEQVTSATGIEYLAQDYLFEHDEKSILRDFDYVGAKEIFDAAKDGDKGAEEIMKQYNDHLGRGLAIIAAIVDPDVFVIGGGVSNAGKFLIDGIQQSFKQYAFSVLKDVKFELATLGNDAGMFGAAKLILS